MNRPNKLNDILYLPLKEQINASNKSMKNDPAMMPRLKIVGWFLGLQYNIGII